MKITKIYPALILFFILLSGCIEFNNSNYTSDSSYSSYDKYNFIQTHEHFYGSVYRVVDGDTVYVVAPNGTEYKIRLLGVDTPETYQKNSASEYYVNYETPITDIEYLDLWGHIATNYTKIALENKSVIVVFDKNGDKQDKYGRYLAYIFINDENFNENLIEYGYARVYVSDFELKSKFLETEKTAKSEKIGIWGYNN